MVNTTVAVVKGQASRNTAAFEAPVEHWARILVSDGSAVSRPWRYRRQTCLTHRIRRARGLSEREASELAWFGRRVRAALRRWVPWAPAPPTSDAGQTR
jgi:hypothetical protein